MGNQSMPAPAAPVDHSEFERCKVLGWLAGFERFSAEDKRIIKELMACAYYEGKLAGINPRPQPAEEVAAKADGLWCTYGNHAVKDEGEMGGKAICRLCAMAARGES